MRGRPQGVVHFLPVFPFFLPARLRLAARLGDRRPQNGVSSQMKSPAQTPRSQPPLANAQRFALEKESQTCNRGLALWTASKQPQSPGFPLKESSAVGKDRNGIRNKAVLRSVEFNQEVPFKLSVPFKLHQVKSTNVWCETFLFMATEITLETAEGGVLIRIMGFLDKRGR